MSWPDGWTIVHDWRGNGRKGNLSFQDEFNLDYELLPLGLDSHRYRCCGNGVVSNVSEWIGVRLARAVQSVGERAA